MTATSPPLDEAFVAAAERCRRALETDFAGLATRLPGAPADPEGWFALLAGVPEDPAAMDRLARLAAASGEGTAVERFAVLNALLAAAPQMRRAAADDTVKRLFCDLCAQVAAPPPAWIGQFALTGAPFAEMAQLASLRRLPAGQLVFDFTSIPHSWLLKFHPRDLPAALREIAHGLGGFGPVVAPHLNHWRANPLLLLQREYLRSLWRIARTLEQHPEVRGLMADAWFYAAEVGGIFPHLAWVRRFFLENGASFFEMEAAAPESGFMVGSARRRQLYRDGRFQPRRTLVLWRRADLLAWATAHPDGEESGAPPSGPRHVPVVRPVAARPVRRLWNGTALLNRRPKTYALATLLAPALVLALGAAMPAPWLFLPVFAAAVPLFWIAQYFYFQ